MNSDEPELTDRNRSGRTPRRWYVLVLTGSIAMLIAGCVALFAVYGQSATIKFIGLHYQQLKHVVDAHLIVASMLYVLGYGCLGLFFLPGSALYVVIGGLLFGVLAGVPLALMGSVLAAAASFATARSLGGPLASWKSPKIVENLKRRITDNALMSTIVLRLTPGLPFAGVNAMAALSGLPLRTFLAGSLIGLIPSRLILSTAGAGLAHAIDVQNAQYWLCIGDATGPAACPYTLAVMPVMSKTWLIALAVVTVATLAAVFVSGFATSSDTSTADTR